MSLSLTTRTTRTPSKDDPNLKERKRLAASLQSQIKENEELRTYIDVLKSALDSRAAQLGFGNKKGVVLEELEELRQEIAKTQKDNKEKAQRIIDLSKQVEQCEADVRAAQQRMEQAVNEEDRLRKIAVDLQKKGAENEDKADNFEEELTKLKEDHGKLTEQFEKSKEQNTLLTTKLEELTNEKQRLQEECDKQNLMSGASEQHIRTLSHSLAAKDTALEKLQAENSKMTEQIEQLRAENETIHAAESDARELQKDLLKAHSDMKDDLEAAQLEAKRLEGEVELMQKKMQLAEENCAKKENEMKKEIEERERRLQDVIDKLKQEADESGRQRQNLTQEKGAQERELVELKERVKAAEERERKVAEEAARNEEVLEQNIGQLDAEVEETKTKCAQLEDSLKKANEELQELKMDNNQLKNEVEKTGKENESLKETISNLKEEQRIERKMLHEQLHAARMEKTEKEDRLREKEGHFSILRHQLDAVVSASQTKDAMDADKMKQCLRQCEMLRQDLKKKSDENERIRSEAREMAQKIAELKAENEHVTRNMSRIEQEKQEAEEQVRSLDENKEVLIGQINQGNDTITSIQYQLVMERQKSGALQAQLNEKEEEAKVEGNAFVERIHAMEAEAEKAAELAKQKLEKVEQELREQTRMTEEKRAALDVAVGEKEHLMQMVEQLRGEVQKERESFGTQLSQLTERGQGTTDKIEQILRSHQKEMVEKQAEVEQQMRKVMETQLELKEAQGKIGQLEAELAKEKEVKEAELRFYREHTIAQHSDQEGLMDELNALKTELTETNRQLEEVTKRKDAAEAELAEISATSSDLKSDAENVAAIKRELEGMLRGLQQKQSEMASEEEQMKAELSAVEEDLHSCRDKLKREMAAHASDKARLEAELASKAEELAVVKQQAQTSQEQLKEKIRHQSLAEQDSRAVRTDLAALVEQRNQLEADLAVAVKELENYQDSFGLSEAALNVMKAELEEQNAAAVKEREHMEQEMHRMESALRDAQETLSAKEQRLSELESLYEEANRRCKQLMEENMKFRLGSSPSQPNLSSSLSFSSSSRLNANPSSRLPTSSLLLSPSSSSSSSSSPSPSFAQFARQTPINSDDGSLGSFASAFLNSMKMEKPQVLVSSDSSTSSASEEKSTQQQQRVRFGTNSVSANDHSA